MVLALLQLLRLEPNSVLAWLSIQASSVNSLSVAFSGQLVVPLELIVT